MLTLRKMVFAGTLSLALTLGSSSAFAASLDDTVGIPGEVSMNKLVSLHVLTASGTQYNPDADLSRSDFVYALSKVLKLNAPKSVKIKDVSTKSKDYASVAKVVGNGLLKLDAKGNFNSKNAVTFTEFSRALASGLGLKASWTDRPIDFLFYLERRGVLSIDTDLDAVVTREQAAVALDQFIGLKELFKSDGGVVAQLQANGLVLNNGADNVTYKLAKDASLFLSGQSAELTSFGAGTPVQLLFNDKGEVAFMSGHGLSLEEGTIVYSDGKVKINDNSRNIDLNAVVQPLPNNSDTTLTLKSFGNYSKAGVTFSGGAYVNNFNDEVTMLDVRFAKVEEKPFTIGGNGLTLDFSGDALANQTFAVADDVKITLKGAKEGDKDSAPTLAELRALQTGNTLTGNVEINADGIVTSIVAKAEAKTAKN